MTCARLLMALTLTTAIGSTATAQTLTTPRLFDHVPACADAVCGEASVAPDTATATTAEHVSVSQDLFAPLGRDFKHLFTPDSALWLGLGGAAALAVHPRDRQVTHTLVSSSAEESLDAGTVLGSGLVQFGGALGTYAIGRATHKREIASLGADLFRAQVVAGALTQGVKFAVQRTRPDGSSYSFPSGHTSSAFATAAVLQRHYGWKVGIPAFALAGYVGSSRLAENRHYLSDVLMGAAVGVISAHAVTIGHGQHRFAVGPMAVPGGAGIGFVHVGSN